MDPVDTLTDRLSEAQRHFLARELGDYQLTANYSWPLQDTVVAEATSRRGRVIIKAATGEITGHHLTREITALRETVPHAPGLPRLLAADLDARVLITAYLPGRLVEGTRWEGEPGIYRQAGALAALVHAARPPRMSGNYQRRLLERARATHALARDLLDPAMWEAAGAELAEIAPAAVQVVPTHGDMQPRNWLVESSGCAPDAVPRLALIDFGRAEWRPWYSDLVRLHHQQFVRRPDLRDAFWAGGGWSVAYPVAAGDEPGWLLENLLQSLGTVVWATDVGDMVFADSGRAMLGRTLRERGQRLRPVRGQS